MKARFTTPAILLSRNGAPAVALGGRLFRKEIVRTGETWVHPSTGQIVAFTADDLRALAAESNAYAASQDFRVPFPDGHIFTAEANLGFWKAFAVEGDRLVGTVEAGDDKVAEALGGRIRDVSAWIESGMKDSKGRTYGPAIRHVCATPEPVIRGSNFEPVALSREGVSIPVYVPTTKEKPMLKIVTALALAANANEDAVVEAVTALSARATTAEAKVTALSAKVTALEADKVAHEKAEIDGVIAGVTALATAAGKPDAWTADDQKAVRELWPTNRSAAQRMVALAKNAIGVPASGEATVVKTPDKVALAQQAADRLEGSVKLARASGATIKKTAAGTFAVRTDGVEVKLG